MFKQYKRMQIGELRPVTDEDIREFKRIGLITFTNTIGHFIDVSISREDINNGSPIIGDMIARNPKNHNDQWLVAKKYFEDNFEECTVLPHDRK